MAQNSWGEIVATTRKSHFCRKLWHKPRLWFDDVRWHLWLEDDSGKCLKLKCKGYSTVLLVKFACAVTTLWQIVRWQSICLRKWILTKQRQGHIWHGHAHKCCWFKDIASPWFTVTLLLLFSYLRLFSFYVSLAPHMLYLYMYIHLYIVFSLLFLSILFLADMPLSSTCLLSHLSTFISKPATHTWANPQLSWNMKAALLWLFAILTTSFH